MLSVRSLAQSCLGKSGALSVREDVHGVYPPGNTHFALSLRDQLTLVSTKPFVKIAMFHVFPKGSDDRISVNAHIDMRRANELYQTLCGLWVYVTSASPIYTDRFGPDVTIEVEEGEVSEDEEDLFALGNDSNADIIGYYVGTARRAGRTQISKRRFWVVRNFQDGTADFYRGYIMAHEMAHAIAGLKDIEEGPPRSVTNLMCAGANCIWDDGPTLNDDQRSKILNSAVVRPPCSPTAGVSALTVSPQLRAALSRFCGNEAPLLEEYTDSDLQAVRAHLALFEFINPAVRRNALRLLGRWGDETLATTVRELFSMMREGDRTVAIASLSNPGIPGALEVVIQARHDPSVAVRRAVVRTLGKIGTARALGYVKEIAEKDPDPDVRTRASRMLRLASNDAGDIE